LKLTNKTLNDGWSIKLTEKHEDKINGEASSSTLVEDLVSKHIEIKANEINDI
jgi:hypothetical protein